MTGFKRLNILVEGPTEETFVRNPLAVHLGSHHVAAVVRSVETGRRHNEIFRGGMSRYAKVKRDIERWLAQDPTAYLTTMFDFYRLPVDFPGVDQTRLTNGPYRKVAQIEQQLTADISNPRFIAYVQLHEFEGLLFSDIGVLDATLLPHNSTSRIKELTQIRAAVKSPEEIDEGEKTAPSKRLLDLYSAYDKTAFGPLIAQRIGVDKIRSQCPHFNAWLSRIEALASA